MKQRVITGIIWGVLLLSFMWIGGLPFSIFVTGLAVIAFQELMAMRGFGVLSFPSIIAYLLLVLYELHAYIPRLTAVRFDTFLIFYVLLLLTWTVFTKNRFHFDDAAYASFGFAYLAYGFHSAIEMRITSDGLFLFFLFQFIIWATDSGAYFVGRSIGGKKLWPEISPKKTIAGSVGGSILAAILCVCFVWMTSKASVYPIGLVAGFAILVSICGQVGDLIESAVKRHYQIKDSGSILPGHGGIFDRLDSFVFAAPIAWGLIQWWF